MQLDGNRFRVKNRDPRASLNVRVLLVTKSLVKGGAATGARQLSQALSATGAEVIAVGAYEQSFGARIRLLRGIERSLERVFFDADTHCLRLGGPSLDLIKLCKQFVPDVVQLCDISGNVVSMADFHDANCPIIHRLSDFWPYHGPAHYVIDPSTANKSRSAAHWFYTRTISPHFALPDAITAPSSWLADNLKLPQTNRVRVEIIKNAVETPDSPCVRNIKRDRLRLGFIANRVLDPRKGFDRLNNAVGVLKRAGYDVETHVFGRIRQADKCSLGGAATIYHGTFGPSELPRVYDTFDILLCPSRLDNSPNVVCEALAWGCPVVAQRGTGVDSYITKDTGRLVDFSQLHDEAPKARAEAAQESLLHAITDIWKHFENFSLAAGQYARRDLAFDKVGAAYMRLYGELLEGTRSGD